MILNFSNLVIEPSTSTAAAPPSAANNVAYSYDDLFPALPESSTPRFPNAAPSNSIKRIGSTVVTQVFYVPSSERKYENDKFGEGEELK